MVDRQCRAALPQDTYVSEFVPGVEETFWCNNSMCELALLLGFSASQDRTKYPATNKAHSLKLQHITATQYKLSKNDFSSAAVEVVLTLQEKAFKLLLSAVACAIYY